MAACPITTATPAPLIGIVDDDESGARYLARLLKQSGYEAVVHPCGEDALRAMAERVPALVVLDPDLMDGMECLRLIRSNGRLATTPVVVYSGDFTHERMKEAMRLGAREYVVKGSMRWSDFLALIRKYSGPGEVAPHG